MRVLVDTNVLLDRILTREPYSDDAEKIIDLCVRKEIDGYIAANSILNIFYIVRREISDRNRRRILMFLREIMSVVAVNDEILEQALNHVEFKDFEDCVQYLCAKEIDADYIVTRNIQDFTESDIPAVKPDEFLKRIK